MMVMPLPVGGAPASPKKPMASSPTKQRPHPAPLALPVGPRATASPPLSPASAAKMDRVLRGARAARLRASLLQTMLALLDREDEPGLQGTLSLLHALSALPLDDPRERARCFACLRALDRRRGITRRRQSVGRAADDAGSAFGSDGDDEREVDIDELESDDESIDSCHVGVRVSSSVSRVSSSNDEDEDDDDDDDEAAAADTPSFVDDRRDSGRPKGVSLHHCRAFLLACANEIHELDAEDPAFDYAEDTASEAAGIGRRLGRPAPGSVLAGLHARPSPAAALGLDYASSAADATSVATSDLSFRLHWEGGTPGGHAGRDDDLDADQGSQLSEVLYRAEFLTEDEDEDDAASARPRRPTPPSALRGRFPHHHEDVRGPNRALCRHVFAAWRVLAAANASPAAVAAKQRAFGAWKRARGLSRASLARKRRAFRRLRLRGPVASAAPYRLFPAAARPAPARTETWRPAVAAAVRAVALPRADAALLLALALLLHAAASL